MKLSIRSAIIAGATKGGAILIRKLNEDGKLQERANDIIDLSADKAKSVAKIGVSKAISLTEEKAGKKSLNK